MSNKTPINTDSELEVLFDQWVDVVESLVWSLPPTETAGSLSGLSGSLPGATFAADAGESVNSPLKKALLTGFHSTAKHNATKAVSPSSETMRTI